MDIVTTPIVSCSKDHQKIYHEWFSYADSDGDGRITGADAIKFFAMSKLSRPELKQVWAIADSKRQGFLGFREFITAMQDEFYENPNKKNRFLFTTEGLKLVFEYCRKARGKYS